MRRSFLLFGLLGLVGFAASAFATLTYRTFTLGMNGYFVETQAVYAPSRILAPEIFEASDLFLDDRTGDLYIADTGNSRVLVLSDQGERTLGDFTVFFPSGVFVDEEGKVYVADTGTFSAFVFEADGTLQGEITRPDSPVFGASNLFIPLKIAADRRGNIYVLCEGAHNGLVNLNRDGEFMGYFAANRPEVSLKMLFQRLIFSESQLDQLLKVKPPSPTNLALDSAGLVHTVTHGIS
ncbi:MAG TPA: gluconolactonase, partial [Thermotogota bacterium]|nr:gluconolactonase [Thermotogota bacterium]